MLQKAASRAGQKRATQKRPMISKSMQYSIIQEAHAMGLTPREYLQLTTEVARNIRESFGKGKEQDALQLLKIVQNPFFVIVLRGVAETFLKNATLSSEQGDHSEENPTKQAQIPQVDPLPSPVRQTPPPYPMYEFW